MQGSLKNHIHKRHTGKTVLKALLKRGLSASSLTAQPHTCQKGCYVTQFALKKRYLVVACHRGVLRGIV